MNNKITYWDFVPPIVIRFSRKIRSLLNFLSSDEGEAGKDSIIIHPYVNPALGSFSQFNEDLLIALLFSKKEHGFYLDIGANDPSFNSNTKLFYDQGWSGINIEPGIEPFNKLCVSRPRDINLNIGVGPDTGVLDFYQVDSDSTLSSFDVEVAQNITDELELTVSEVPIQVIRLEDVFRLYVKDKNIDFMTLDAEGLDLQILQSNDWAAFRPSLIVVEIDSQYEGIIAYLRDQNYRLLYNNYHNGIFLDRVTKEECLTPLANRV